MPRKEIFTFVIWRKPQKASPTTSTFIQVKSASLLQHCIIIVFVSYILMQYAYLLIGMGTHTHIYKTLKNSELKPKHKMLKWKWNQKKWRHKHKNINISFLSLVLSVYYSYSWCYATRVSSKKYIYLWDSNQKYNMRNWRHAYTFIYKFVL